MHCCASVVGVDLTFSGVLLLLPFSYHCYHNDCYSLVFYSRCHAVIDDNLVLIEPNRRPRTSHKIELGSSDRQTENIAYGFSDKVMEENGNLLFSFKKMKCTRVFFLKTITFA